MKDTIRLGLVPAVARLFLASEFLIAANGKIQAWDGQAAYMASHGMSFVTPLLAAALVIELVGSLCLLTGVQASIAAAVMCVYLAIVSVCLHDFWNLPEATNGAAMTQFFKNVGIMGGLLAIAAYGPGKWSLGRRSR